MNQTTIGLILLVIPTFVGVYSFWASAKKDGFDHEKTFDLLVFGFLGAAVMGLGASVIERRTFLIDFIGINPFICLFGFVGITCLVVIRWRWSLYRVLDNLAVASILSAGFWLLIQNIAFGIKPVYVVTLLLLFISYWLFQKYRLLLLKSGFSFCLVGGIFCLTGMLMQAGVVNLIFIILLFTLTLTVLIFRVRSIYGGHKKIASTTHSS